MNVTELARQLNIHPKKLLETLPEFGFDIGIHAVKVDDRVAERIKREWRRIKFVLEQRAAEELKKQKEKEKALRQATGATIVIPATITVKELSQKLDLPVNKLIVELMKNGILSNQNERLDHDTASIIAEDLGFKVEAQTEKQTVSVDSEHTKNLETVLQEDATVARPPVVVVMGHVDHGKTKLLDAIRSANVVDSEAGGITQHIGAYQVKREDPKTKEKKLLTFIDTPGHEAFTVMRSRGAKVADIAILVVAADDGVQPQTIEAINIAKAAKIPVVVAINKIDKEGADPQKVRTDLSSHGLITEEWGGEVPMVEISAKQKLNIDKLLDNVLAVADVQQENIKANPARAAAGTVVEAHVDKGEGPVATILVQTGTLRVNDPLVVNGEIYGKVRAMRNYRGEMLKEAPPSTPVRILGFKVAPQVGDVLDVEKAATSSNIDVRAKKSAQSGAEQKQTSSTDQQQTDEEKAFKFFNVVLKTDMLGSLEAILGSLEKMKNDEVGVKVVSKGLGNITTKDVDSAVSAGAVILGFNVDVVPEAKVMLQSTNIQFRQFRIIYDLLDSVSADLQKLLNPEIVTTELGNFKIMEVFRAEKGSAIVGGRVESGKLLVDAIIRVKREGEYIGKGKISKLQLSKQNVKEVPSGTECGMQFDGKIKLEKGDVLEAYKEEKKEKKLILN